MKTVADPLHPPAWFNAHAAIRTDAYVLLGALLTTAPTKEMIDTVRNLSWQEDLPLAQQNALAALRRAGERCPIDAIAKEYQRLFIGLGSGELVPYGSWYLEQMIQSAPLAQLRTALGRLGLVRRAESHESEDQAGALCESMALLSLPANAVPQQEQADFFHNHIGSWMGDFFMDLQQVENAAFYPAVGGFGRCFIKAESEYLGMRLRTVEA